ncbi:MAG: C10 family peptidase, partial [Muribaculaceae bacterium]|nr:C10 family peptidase [Muribaculaceae bacterium]
MKYFFYLFMSLIVAGCSMNEPVENKVSKIDKQTLPAGIKGEILLNLLTQQNKGYNALHPTTRSNDITIHPYIENGDTLMYIVEDGIMWQIYSGKYSSPMLLFSCENNSSFDLSDPVFPDPLRSLINSVAENIKTIDTLYPDSIDPSWILKNISSQDLANGIIIDKRKQNSPGSIQPAAIPPGSPIPDENGEWVLIETKIVGDREYTSDKLIKTKWNQSYPWNNYCKKVTKDGNTFTIPVGCAPVAVAQYQYYTHFKDGTPL